MSPDTYDNRVKYLERLKSIEGSYLYYDNDSNGYGSNGRVYLLHSNGVTGDVTIGSDVSISIITEDEIKVAKELIDNDQEEDIDSDLLEMINQDCEPGIKYVKNYHGYYQEHEDFLADAASDGESFPWDEMAEEELEEWCDILDVLEVEEREGC